MADDFGLGDFAATLGEGNFDVGTVLPPDIGAGAGTGGFWSGLSDFAGNVGSDLKGVGSGFGDFAKGALPFAQLGAAGLGLAGGLRAADQNTAAAKSAAASQKLQQDAAGNALNIAKPLQEFGQASLARAAGGQIPEAAQAKIEEWKQGKKAEMRDYLARAGLGDSQSLQMAEAQIDRMSAEMVLAEIERENALGLQALGGATSATSAAAGAAGAAGQAATQGEVSLAQMIALANQELARVGAGAK